MSNKRKRRAASKQKTPPQVQDEIESGDPNERPTRDRQPNVIKLLFNNNSKINNNKYILFKEFINSAFVNDAGDHDHEQTNNTTTPTPSQQEQVEEEKGGGGGKVTPSSILTRHRDKSRELANALKQDDDPNQVSERIRGVQERVRDKLRPLLHTTQTLTSPTGGGGGGPPDLRLDLTGATSNVNDLNGSQTLLSTGAGTQRFNASDKAREAAEHRLRKIKESSYRTAAASGPTRRDTTRFDDDDETAATERHAAEEKHADSLARFRFKKIGLAVIEVTFWQLFDSIPN